MSFINFFDDRLPDDTLPKGESDSALELRCNGGYYLMQNASGDNTLNKMATMQDIGNALEKRLPSTMLRSVDELLNRETKLMWQRVTKGAENRVAGWTDDDWLAIAGLTHVITEAALARFVQHGRGNAWEAINPNHPEIAQLAWDVHNTHATMMEGLAGMRGLPRSLTGTLVGNIENMLPPGLRRPARTLATLARCSETYIPSRSVDSPEGPAHLIMAKFCLDALILGNPLFNQEASPDQLVMRSIGSAVQVSGTRLQQRVYNAARAKAAEGNAVADEALKSINQPELGFYLANFCFLTFCLQSIKDPARLGLDPAHADTRIAVGSLQRHAEATQQDMVSAPFAPQRPLMPKIGEGLAKLAVPQRQAIADLMYEVTVQSYGLDVAAEPGIAETLRTTIDTTFRCGAQNRPAPGHSAAVVTLRKPPENT